MFKLSKKVEYAILSLQYMAERDGKLISAKEISENMQISFEFLAKTLQTLMKKGLIESVQGIKGGYQLAVPAKEITLDDIVSALGSKPELVDCISEHDGHECTRIDNCTIRKPLLVLQKKVDEIFTSTTVADLCEPQIVNISFKN